VDQERAEKTGGQQPQGDGQQIRKHAERRVVDRKVRPDTQQEDQDRQRRPPGRSRQAAAASATSQGNAAAETRT